MIFLILLSLFVIRNFRRAWWSVKMLKGYIARKRLATHDIDWSQWSTGQAVQSLFFHMVNFVLLRLEKCTQSSSGDPESTDLFCVPAWPVEQEQPGREKCIRWWSNSCRARRLHDALVVLMNSLAVLKDIRGSLKTVLFTFKFVSPARFVVTADYCTSFCPRFVWPAQIYDLLVPLTKAVPCLRVLPQHYAFLNVLASSPTACRHLVPSSATAFCFVASQSTFVTCWPDARNYTTSPAKSFPEKCRLLMRCLQVFNAINWSFISCQCMTTRGRPGNLRADTCDDVMLFAQQCSWDRLKATHEEKILRTFAEISWTARCDRAPNRPHRTRVLQDSHSRLIRFSQLADDVTSRRAPGP